MAKSNAQIQQEYNEALKVSQSLTGALNKMIDDTAKGQKKLSDAQKKYNDGLKNIINSATDVESTEEAIIKLEKQKEGLSKRYFGANAKLLPAKRAELDVGIKSLQNEARRLTMVENLDKSAQDLAGSLNGSLDGLLSGLNEIPVLGKAFSGLASGPVNYLKGSVSNAAKVFTTRFSAATAEGMSGMRAFASAGGSSMSSLVGALAGPQAIIAAIIAVLALGVLAFYKIEKAARAFRDETGLLNSQTQQMSGNINKVYMETVGLGASMEDVAKAAADFTNEFGGIEQPMASTMKSMTVLSKNFGISTQDAAKLNKAFQNMGGLSEDVAQSNIESLTALAAQEGVAPRQVMADIAESAEEAGGFFKGNVQALGAAAINAAKMGSSLKEAVKVSRGLLDYQSSVSNEMEASAILGTNLNFSQSRYLAAQGDVVGAQAEMVKQLRNQVDLENASVYEREALEKATGMQFSQIQNMARLQEMNLGLDESRNKVLQEALKNGLDISNMSKEQLLAKTEELAKQQEMQGELESMGNSLKGIGAKLLQAFLPIGKVVIGLLKPIGWIAETLGNRLAAGIKYVGNGLMAMWKIVKGIFTLDFSSIKEGLIEAFMNPLNYIKDLFPKTFEKLSSFVTGIKDKFMKMIPQGVLDSLSESFNSMKESWNKIKGTFSKAFEQVKNAFMPVKEAFSKIFSSSGETGGFMKTLSSVFGFIGKIVATVIGTAFTAIANIVSGIATVFGGIADIFSGEKTFGEALLSIGTGLWEMVSAIPSALWDAFTSIFGGIGTWLGQKIRGIVGDTAADFMGLPAMAEGGIVTQATTAIVGEAGAEAIIPLDKLGTMIGSGGGTSVSMDSVVAELKELKAAFLSNKDVYIDNEKVTSRITKTQEKSSINQFGLMGA